MNTAHKAIRTVLTDWPPDLAKKFVRSMHLPAEEELCIIACDVEKKSYTQISLSEHISPETVKKRRQRGYDKIEYTLFN